MPAQPRHLLWRAAAKPSASAAGGFSDSAHRGLRHAIQNLHMIGPGRNMVVPVGRAYIQCSEGVTFGSGLLSRDNPGELVLADVEEMTPCKPGDVVQILGHQRR